jgi:uncharacterized protein (TIGR02246 family)
MKKIILSGSLLVSMYARSQGFIVASRFETMMEQGHPEWIAKINQSSINKSIMKKTIILSIMTTLVMGAATAQSKTTDEQAIRTIVSTMEAGWNNKNGESFSSVFADVHDYIVVNGFYFPGFTRQGNAAAHQGLFNGVYKTVDIRLNVDKISFVRNDLALIHVLGGSYQKGTTPPADPMIIMTILAEKKNDSWKIISFHNHDLTSFHDKDRSPVPLNVMYASWYKK